MVHSTVCGYDQSYICLNQLFIVSRTSWHELWCLVRHLSADKMISALITADSLLTIFLKARAVTPLLKDILSTTSLGPHIVLHPKSTEVETISVSYKGGKCLEELQRNTDVSILEGQNTWSFISTGKGSSNKPTWSGSMLINSVYFHFCSQVTRRWCGPCQNRSFPSAPIP